MPGLFGRTGRIASGGGWLPTDIGGCKLWLRSDFAWQDAEKTVPCVDSSLVWTGEDKSLTGDAIQATESKRPVYLTNGINGHPVWHFDGLDDRLELASAPVDPPCTIAIVGQYYAGSYLDVQQAITLTNGLVLAFKNDIGTNYSVYRGAWIPGSYSLLETPTILVMRENNYDDINFTINGNSENITTGTSYLSLAANYIGNDQYNQGAHIDFSEMLLYDSYISASNLARLMTYLNTEAQGTGYATY